MKLMEGRTALVTGAARGMGAAVAELFVEEGARVVIADVLEGPGRELAARLGEHAALSVPLDVGNEQMWTQAIDAAEKAFGPVTVLVNNAGVVGGFGPFESTTVEAFQQTYSVNVLGPFLGIRAVIPSMRAAGGGTVVNVSSLDGLIGQGYVPAYVTSKWAVRGLTKSAALELYRYKIRVNSVHPGVTSTPMTAASDTAAETADQPITRPADPREIAQMILFAASGLSSYSTGCEFIADGGASAGVVGRPEQ